MKYLLDTNAVISMMKRQHGMQERILEAGLEQCAVSEITLAELYVGFYKGKDERQRREVEAVKRLFTILPITEAIELYAQNRAELELTGRRIDDFDLLIGSTAVCHNLTLVTHNSRHFLRIPNLQIMDWETK